MSHDVFISFSSRDLQSAQRICERIEQSGLRCWLSARDVGPGENYQEAIVAALQGAPVFALVFSSNSNDSQEVHKELSLASAFKKVVIPVRIADVVPKGAFAYELATRQWVDAFTSWDKALDQLVTAAQRAAGVTVQGGGEVPPEQRPPQPAPVQAAPPPPTPPAPSIFSKEQLETARAALAVYLGPIADVLVRKAAADARSVNDLHQRLAAQIPQPDEQAAFRQQVKRRF